jgi:hypothetical protein
MPKEARGELVIVETFEYRLLEDKLAEQVRSAANRIRESLHRTLAGLIEVGKELHAVKDVLPHGRFGRWLRAEFGWGERTARNFMAVAERFGPKTAIIAEMRIDPTAAYLLAAPSAPDEARRTAVERAEAGERITAGVAKEILAKSRKKVLGRRGLTSTEGLGERLRQSLERIRAQWDSRKVAELAQRLRDFADALEAGRAGRNSGSR